MTRKNARHDGKDEPPSLSEEHTGTSSTAEPPPAGVVASSVASPILKDEVERMKRHILSCPNLDEDSEVIQTLLHGLDDQLLKKGHQRSETPPTTADEFSDERWTIHSPTPSSPPSSRRDLVGGTKEAEEIDQQRQQQLKYMPLNKGRSFDRGLLQDTTKKKRTRGWTYHILLGHLFRSILLDLPLTLLFVVYLILASLHYTHDTYILDMLQAMEFDTTNRTTTEATFYHKYCDITDMSTFDPNDLVVNNTDDAVTMMLKHGASFYPNVLSPETASEVRDFVLWKNEHLDPNMAIGVHGDENGTRWSFGITPNDHPSIPKALREISTNPLLRTALESIIGPNPALVEMTTITSAYGSEDQHVHQDVIWDGSAQKFSRTFVPTYSLFIPLQDTTADMGATWMCPGTHSCSMRSPTFCEQYGFPLSGFDGVWKVGDAALFNQQTFHKGRGHVDPNGPIRALFILSFAQRPSKRVESRMHPTGGSFSTRWDMWGHTLNDLTQAESTMKYPWSILRSWGLYKSAQADWGWDYVTIHAQRIVHRDTNFDDVDLEEFRDELGGFGLPHWLEGRITCEDYDCWHGYLLDTVLRCEDFAWKVNGGVLGFYLLILMMCSLWSWWRCHGRNNSGGSSQHPRRESSLLKRCLLRLLLTHGTILVITGYLLYVQSQSNWVKDLKSGRLLQNPFPSRPATSSSSSLPTLLLPSPRNYPPALNETIDTDKRSDGKETSLAVLPWNNDVLIGTRFDSKDLGNLYNRWLEVHPGNKHYNTLLNDEVAILFNSYQALPQPFQDVLLQYIIRDIWNLNGRFLLQQYDTGEWKPITSHASLEYTRKELLNRGSSRLVQTLKRELTFMETDCLYGLRRDTSLCRNGRYNGGLLGTLWYRMFHSEETRMDVEKVFVKECRQTTVEPAADDGKGRDSGGKFIQQHPFRTTPSSYAARQMQESNVRQKVGKPARKMGPQQVRDITKDGPSEPFENAWLKVGDVVEGRYRNEFNEWYKGIIVRVDAAQGGYDVQYDDGEIDPLLTPPNIRRFIPFQVGDFVEAARTPNDDEEWYKGTIVKILPKDLFRVKFKHNNRVINGLPRTQIRRYDPLFRVGDRVLSRFRGGRGRGEWFPGTIIGMNRDETYNVEYDDGDVDYNLDEDDVQFEHFPEENDND